MQPLVLWSGAIGIAAVLGCGSSAPSEELGRSLASVGNFDQAFVNGADDRLEYFELSESWQRAALEQFTVALMRDDTARAVTRGRFDVLPTWGDVNQLCEGEPFSEQPAASFCSGVLVDWDLVLTSGHCVNALPIEELRVVFDYYYQRPDDVAMTDDDVYAVRRVIAARRDEEDPEAPSEQLDFAWLELAEPAREPHQPAPTFTRSAGIAPRDPVISIGAGGGVPIKWDEGGRVQSLGSRFDDYFVADTDTSQGSSGGGLFDSQLAVVGTLARGAADFEQTPAGCYVTRTESDPTAAREQFTYVHRAVEALCAAGSDSVLCAPTCVEPCAAAAVERIDPDSSPDDGCALGGGPGHRQAPLGRLALGWLALGLLGLVRRRHADARSARLHP